MITAPIAPVERRYELVPHGETGVLVDLMVGEPFGDERAMFQAGQALRVLEHAAVVERHARALAQLSASATNLADTAAATHEDLRARWRDGTPLW